MPSAYSVAITGSVHGLVTLKYMLRVSIELGILRSFLAGMALVANVLAAHTPRAERIRNKSRSATKFATIRVRLHTMAAWTGLEQ